MWELDYKEKLSAEELMLLNCGWRRLLRVPWTARRSSQSILKEISPEYSLEGRMLKLKFQYSGHLMWRTDSLEKTLVSKESACNAEDLGSIPGSERSSGEGNGCPPLQNSRLENPMDTGAWQVTLYGVARVKHDWATKHTAHTEWERLKVGGEGDDSRWDGWMASPTRWTWIWISPGS